MVISFPRTGDQEVEQVAGDCRVAGSIPHFFLLKDEVPMSKTLNCCLREIVSKSLIVAIKPLEGINYPAV